MSVSTFPIESYRDRYKRSPVTLTNQISDENISKINENGCRKRLHVTRYKQRFSYYDNVDYHLYEQNSSKWAVVRQRLPEILALGSKSYKSTNARDQLILLVALMSKQSNVLNNRSIELNINDRNETRTRIAPNTVVLDINGRSRTIYLKRIPSEQIIHVDIDSLSYSIPTREFILAISRQNSHRTASRFCPPAISDMLIELSKTKIVDDRRQYERAQFKMRLGQILFVIAFVLIIIMIFILLLGVTNSIVKLESLNKTYPFLPIKPLKQKPFGNITYRTLKENDYE